MVSSGATFRAVRREIGRSRRAVSGDMRMAEWGWDCWKRLLGTLTVEEFFVEFWSLISIWSQGRCLTVWAIVVIRPEREKS